MLFVSTRKCHLSLANFHCQRLTKLARREHISTNYIQHRDNPTSQQSAHRVLPQHTHTHTHFDKLPQTAEILETVLGNMSNNDLLHKPITPNDAYGCQVGKFPKQEPLLPATSQLYLWSMPPILHYNTIQLQ